MILFIGVIEGNLVEIEWVSRSSYYQTANDSFIVRIWNGEKRVKNATYIEPIALKVFASGAAAENWALDFCENFALNVLSSDLNCRTDYIK